MVRDEILMLGDKDHEFFAVDTSTEDFKKELEFIEQLLIKQIVEGKTIEEVEL